jgi:hypothetical protein
MRDGNRPPDDRPAEIRLERLLGRIVRTANNRSAGRIEELRAEPDDQGFVIVEYVLGRAGLFERMHVGARMLFGLGPKRHVARWDQLDISDPERPRLLCSVNDLSDA